MRKAAKIGPATIALVDTVMKTKPHPQQSFRACLGILRLARSCGSAGLEAACRRATTSALSATVQSSRSRGTGWDKAYANETPADELPVRRGKIRGTGII
jgi:hypothetical protein